MTLIDFWQGDQIYLLGAGMELFFVANSTEIEISLAETSLTFHKDLSHLQN